MWILQQVIDQLPKPINDCFQFMIKDALKVFQTPTFQAAAGIDDCDLLH